MVQPTEAIVVNRPTRIRKDVTTGPVIPTTPTPFRSTTKHRPSHVRIRSAQPTDFDRIATLLAEASIDEESNKNSHVNTPSPMSFMKRIKMLQTKKSIYDGLVKKHRAIQEGRQALAKSTAAVALEKTDSLTDDIDNHVLRELWDNNDKFRSTLEVAADECSSDPHVWQQHNFALAPRSLSHLQHALLVAQDMSVDGMDGIVGFCELGMLQEPEGCRGSSIHTTNRPDGIGMEREDEATHPDDHDYDFDYSYNYDDECFDFLDDDDDDDDGERRAVPTIGNVVVCPKHRRRGIAGSMIQSALRFVQVSWMDGREVALYVKHDNAGASALYSKYGFVEADNVDSDLGVYMRRPLLQEQAALV